MKDPALLVYTKDFIEGTAHLEPEEMGVYCRLIFHQHQRGSLPSNPKQLARMSGLSPSEFDLIWPSIEDKFSLTDRGYVNDRCDREIQTRRIKARRKSILAVFGNWIKYQEETIPEAETLALKKIFKADQFIDIDDDDERKQNIIRYLSANLNALRVAERSHIANANANAVNNIKSVDSQKFVIAPPIKELADKICEAWHFSEISNQNQYFLCVHFIEHHGIEEVSKQFQGYWAYKQKNEEKTHTFKNWIGTPPEFNGAWNERQWGQAIEQNTKKFTYSEVQAIHSNGRDIRTMKNFKITNQTGEDGKKLWIEK